MIFFGIIAPSVHSIALRGIIMKKTLFSLILALLLVLVLFGKNSRNDLSDVNLMLVSKLSESRTAVQVFSLDGDAVET